MDQAGKHCPRCRGRAVRVHRRGVDHALNLLWRVQRFRCVDSACGWEGIQHVKRHRFGSIERIRIRGMPLDKLLLRLALIAAASWVAAWFAIRAIE